MDQDRELFGTWRWKYLNSVSWSEEAGDSELLGLLEGRGTLKGL